MAYSQLIVERRGRVARIILNNPAALNALSLVMREELGQEVEVLSKDPEVRAIVITGSGRAFCAGGDVKAQASLTGSGAIFCTIAL